jgi:hypothetical protein
MSEIRGYFACLASYNNGRLHGVWVDLAQPVDDVWTEINTMLKQSREPGAEEWAMHDHERIPASLYSEHPDLDKLTAYAQFVDDLDDDDLRRDAVRAWIDDDPSRVDSLDRFDDAYRGHWESSRAFAEDWVNEVGIAGIPAGANVAVVHVGESGYGHTEYGQRGTNLLDDLARFLDWDRVTEDLIENFTEHTAPDGGVFIFDPNV